MLRAAVASGDVEMGAMDYVVPMQRKQSHGRDRDDRVISRIVKKLGARADIEDLLAARGVRGAVLGNAPGPARRCSG